MIAISKKYLNKKSIIRILVVLSITLSGLVNAEDKSVKAIPLDVSDRDREIPVYCQMEPRFKHVVTSEYGAILKSVVEEGSVVQKGDTLAMQNTFYIEQEVKTLEDQLQLINVSIEYYSKELDRRRQLKTTDSGSQADVDELKFRLDSEIHNHSILGRKLAVLKHRVINMTHISKYNAQVHDVEVSPGEHVDNGDAIMTLLPLEDKGFKCSVPLTDYESITKNNPAIFYYKGSELTNYTVTQVLDPNLKLLTIYFEADPVLTRSIYFYERVEISLTFRQARSFRVPFNSIVVENGNKYIWVVDEEKIARRKPIDIIDATTQNPIVSGDLSASDQIVVEGYTRLAEGQKVNVSGGG